MNIDVLQVAVPFAAGIVLGVIYFGGLWLTVRNVHQVQHPALLCIGSFVVRNALVLPAFYLVMDGHWVRIVSCLVGFFIVRYVWIHRIRSLGVLLKVDERMSP
ncbi:ATP synthase subunit I [Symmachiella dynata]|uniref:ATP synthase subunit I n=1 Tax=Symmachiella dynata TaxID=2527995 RepID=UPI0030EB9BB0